MKQPNQGWLKPLGGLCLPARKAGSKRLSISSTFKSPLPVLSSVIIFAASIAVTHDASAKPVKNFENIRTSVADTAITGEVRNEAGEPLMGVSVSVKGSKAGYITNQQGQFVIKAAKNATLEFSFVGYTTQSVPVDNRQSTE